MMRDYFSKNLRLLCSYHKSISEVARQVGMNRQQIMKYLAGTAYPSGRSMRRLCDFFGVEEYEIIMPDDQFRDIVRLKPTLPVASGLTPPVLSALLKGAARQLAQLRPYAGYYYEFRYSFTSQRLVLKSLLQIQEYDGLMMYKSIERLKDQRGQGEAHIRPVDVNVFKYTGILLMIGNRIHMLDQEGLLGQELSHMILFPPYRNRISTLRGMKMGVTATAAHEPIASRVVLEKIGRSVDLRRAMLGCGLYEPRGDGVPASVLDYLGEVDGKGPVLLKSEAGSQA
ncbi:MAG: helix-turn-helix transcriptional regulator [Paracoccaceae bacterium]|mgnify:CR=1 FL=1|nr:helix-turn-helix transcriptional regulator [Paracoccaceae bacterium]